MTYDVIVIGGSYSGMAAALQLLRARRSVLIVDAGKRRNRAASHSHGFLAQDGADPANIARTARKQLEAYATLSWRDGEAVSATGEKDAFEVALGDGSQHHSRRLLLATGVSDTLPNIPGLQDLWGRSVLHCPCCHGYERQLGHIGVIATGPVSIHQAQMLPEWGRVTFNGALELDAAAAKDLAGRGVCVEATSIARLEGHADVVLVDDQRLAFAGLCTAPRKRRLRRLPNRSAVSSWKRHSARRSGRTTRRKLASLVYTRAVMRRGPRTRYRLPWATAHGPARSCIDR